MSPLILVGLLWTSGRGTWIIGHLILIGIHESAKANRLRDAPLTINGAPFRPKGPWSHTRHTHFLDTCSLIFIVVLFAAWLASDLSRLLVHTLRIETVTWIHNTSPTRVILMMCKMSNTSFFTAPIHTWSLSEGHMRPYFLLQASTVCLLFWAGKTTSLVSSFMH